MRAALPIPRRPFLRASAAAATLVVASLSFGLTACSSDATPAPAASLEGTYVGRLEGSDASVGLVVGGGSAIVFVCGGPTSLPATRWFREAQAAPAEIAVGSASGGVRASGTRDRIEGAVDPGDGRSLRFTAARVADDGPLGLYELSDGEGRAGVVVTARDAFQGAFIRSRDGAVLQIVPIRPGPLDLAGDAFTVRVETRDLKVTRVRLR